MADVLTREKELAIVRAYRDNSPLEADTLALLKRSSCPLLAQVIAERDEERALRLESEADRLMLRSLSSYDLSLQDEAEKLRAQALAIREGQE